MFVTKTKGFWGKDAKIAEEVNKVRSNSLELQKNFTILNIG